MAERLIRGVEPPVTRHCQCAIDGKKRPMVAVANGFDVKRRRRAADHALASCTGCEMSGLMTISSVLSRRLDV